MSTVFISHVEADAAVAEAVADCLSQAGYDAWCYERNSLPGVPYITQVLTALGESAAVVVVLSKDALASLQVDKEIIRAYEGNKPFVPLLLGLTHAEFRAHKPEWGMMLGASTSVAVPPEGVATIVPRMVEGLKAMGVHPTHAPGSEASSPASAIRPQAATVGPSPVSATHPVTPAGAFTGSGGSAGAAPARQPGTKPWLLVAGGGVMALLIVGGVIFAVARATTQNPASVQADAPSGQAAALPKGAPAPPQGAAAAPPSNAGPSPGTLLRSDDFSDPAKGLFQPSGRGSSSSITTGVRAPYDYSYSGGALVGHIGPLSTPASGLRIGPRIPARDQVGGDFALVVRARAATSSGQVGYFLWFQPSGGDSYSFAIIPGGGEYGLFPTGTGRLLNGRSSSIAGGDQENLLRLEVRGDAIAMFVKGLPVNRLQHQDFAPRPATVGVGFFITSAPADGTAEVRFQDFTVIALS